MSGKEKTQTSRLEAEQLALLQTKLNDEKKLILYGFALGLKAENLDLENKSKIA